MWKKLRACCFGLFLCCCVIQVLFPVQALCAGATTTVRIVKYAEGGKSVVDEKTVGYEWMEENLPVLGDGETHYYHQGPVFQGDSWDPLRSVNLKDKGAVQGTAVKDLCDLVGGMLPEDEVMFLAVDGWHTKFAYPNIYEPPEEQGIIALCWFNGRDAEEGERYGAGYPGNNAYSSALQIVFMSDRTNSEGKHVFGNADMKIALPQEKYQYFFEGEFPSTNGLSGKWISEIRIYEGGVPEDGGASFVPEDREAAKSPSYWPAFILGLAGAAFIGLYFYMRKKNQ